MNSVLAYQNNAVASRQPRELAVMSLTEQQSAQEQHKRSRSPRTSWQRGDKDRAVRDRIQAKITFVISPNKPSRISQEDWLATKLPKMARKLEQLLYRNSKSLQEYQDESTVAMRLKGIKKKACKRAVFLNMKDMAGRLPDVHVGFAKTGRSNSGLTEATVATALSSVSY